HCLAPELPIHGPLLLPPRPLRACPRRRSSAPSFFLFLLMLRPPPRAPLFPYTTLFRSGRAAGGPRARPGGHLRRPGAAHRSRGRSEEHTSELQSRFELVCRLLLEKKKENAYVLEATTGRQSIRARGWSALNATRKTERQ